MVPLTKFGRNRSLHARDISDQSVARKKEERRKKETRQKQNLAEVIGKVTRNVCPLQGHEVSYVVCNMGHEGQK